MARYRFHRYAQPRPQIEELALQAKGVGIFTAGEYPSNGHMDPEDENIFIIDEMNCSDAFEYSETTEQMSGLKIIKTEIPEKE